MLDLRIALAQRPYPGRGLVVGRLSSGAEVVVYFLTGRSEASRARYLRPNDLADIEVVDTSGGPHDELRHYFALVRRGSWVVAANGDQVEPIAKALSTGSDPVAAFSMHTYEPDPPIWTPRIWVAWNLDADTLPMLGSAQRSDRSGEPDRALWLSELHQVGAGRLLTTYCGTVADVVTCREPLDIAVEAETVEQLLDQVWNGLDSDLRVGAFASEVRDMRSLLLRGQ